MPKFTVQVEYLMPVFMHVQVEAMNVEEACAKALDADDWEQAKDDYESVGPTYVTGIVRGEHEDVYSGGEHCDVPKAHGQLRTVLDMFGVRLKREQFEALKELLDHSIEEGRSRMFEDCRADYTDEDREAWAKKVEAATAGIEAVKEIVE